MKHTIITLATVIIITGGCGVSQHKGRINTYDPNGSCTGSYEAVLDRSMLMEATTTDGIIVKADSRGGSMGELFKGIFEIITLGLLLDD